MDLAQASSPRLQVVRVQSFRHCTALTCAVVGSSLCYPVELYDGWRETDVKKGDIVRVLLTNASGEFVAWASAYSGQPRPNTTRIDAHRNLLVLHPDVLLAGSIIPDSFQCPRKSVIQIRNPRASGPLSLAAFYGILIHELFHQIIELLYEDPSTDSFQLATIPDEILSKKAATMFALEVPFGKALVVLHRAIPMIVQWFNRYGRSNTCEPLRQRLRLEGDDRPNLVATAGARTATTGNPARGTRSAAATATNVAHATAATDSISDVIETEEMIWSPCLGLKGTVDAAVRWKDATVGPADSAQIGVLELKTGMSRGEIARKAHSSQVLLYIMLLSDRYDTQVTRGMLCYIPSTHRQQQQQQQQQQQPTDVAAVSTASISAATATATASSSYYSTQRVQSNAFESMVTSTHADVVALLQQRNRIAAYVQPGTSFKALPPVLRKAPSVCRYCFVRNSCLVQNRLMENGYIHGLGSEFDQALFREHTAHLNNSHHTYYHVWRAVLAAEEAHLTQSVKHLWTMTASERARRRECIANLQLAVIDSVLSTSDTSREATVATTATAAARPKALPEAMSRASPPPPPPTAFAPSSAAVRTAQHHRIVFHRHCQVDPPPMEDTPALAVGDSVLVSVERVVPGAGEQAPAQANGRRRGSTTTWKPALASGFIDSIQVDPTTDAGHRVTVATRRNLINWAHRQRIQVDRMVWRIDSEARLFALRVCQRNLEDLFSVTTPDASKWRRLIVELRTPQLHDTLSPEAHSAVQRTKQVFRTHHCALNGDQERALDCFAKTKDYMLLLGMPGTGKSTTLAALAAHSMFEGRRTLLCAHTHAAVDNILLRLLRLGVSNIVRLGRKSDLTDTRLEPFVFDVTAVQGGAEEIECVLSAHHGDTTQRIVAATCLEMTRPVFSQLASFHVTLIDEASQVLQPICLGPILRTTGRLVLAGDHYQLPPLLHANLDAIWKQFTYASKEDISATNVSLFRWLCDRHPSAICRLTRQYRMAAGIMRLSNEIVYGGRLVCASASVKDQQLAVDITKVARTLPLPLPAWLHIVLRPRTRAVFVNTDPENGEPGVSRRARPSPPSSSSRQHKFENRTEASLAFRIARHLVVGGVAPSTITILSPFRAQVRLLHRQFAQQTSLRDVTISTIDKFQGLENECVMVSFVCERVEGGLSPLLLEWRRLNVALTRAKKKLVLVGSKSTLRTGGVDFHRRLLERLERNTVSPGGIPDGEDRGSTAAASRWRESSTKHRGAR